MFSSKSYFLQAIVKGTQACKLTMEIIMVVIYSLIVNDAY